MKNTYKKKRKIYISYKGRTRSDYIKALNRRYNIIFDETFEMENAHIFLAPYDRSGLSTRQQLDLEKARKLGLETHLVRSETLLNEQERDPLKFNSESMEYEKRKIQMRKEMSKPELEEDEGIELEL